VVWVSKLQTLTATSTAEAEYVALLHACQETLWMRQVMHVFTGTLQSPLVLCDNQTAVGVARDAMVSKFTKHVQIKYHAVRDYHACGSLVIRHTPGSVNPADMFTKPLAGDKIVQYCTMLHIV
jgi:hypothetical protein